MAYDFSHPTWMHLTVEPRNCTASAASVSTDSDRINGSVPPQNGHVVVMTTMSIMFSLDSVGMFIDAQRTARAQADRRNGCVKPVPGELDSSHD